MSLATRRAGTAKLTAQPRSLRSYIAARESVNAMTAEQGQNSRDGQSASWSGSTATNFNASHPTTMYNQAITRGIDCLHDAIQLIARPQKAAPMGEQASAVIGSSLELEPHVMKHVIAPTSRCGPLEARLWPPPIMTADSVTDFPLHLHPAKTKTCDSRPLSAHSAESATLARYRHISGLPARICNKEQAAALVSAPQSWIALK